MDYNEIVDALKTIALRKEFQQDEEIVSTIIVKQDFLKKVLDYIQFLEAETDRLKYNLKIVLKEMQENDEV